VLVEHSYSITWSARPNTDGGIVRPMVDEAIRTCHDNLDVQAQQLATALGKSSAMLPGERV